MAEKSPLIHVLPSIEKLTTIGGFIRGYWISIVGKPGSCKSLICTIACYNWLKRNEKTSVVHCVFEHGKALIIQQAISLGFDLRPFESAGRLIFEDFTDPKDQFESNFSRKVEDKRGEFRRKLGLETETLLIADGMASLWNNKPVSAPTIMTATREKLDKIVDMAILTVKLANDDEAFGKGAEYMTDVLIRVGNYCDEQYEEHRWLRLKKFRADAHDRTAYSMDIKGKEIMIGKKLADVGALYSDVYKAIESRRYDNGNVIQLKRNELLTDFHVVLTELVDSNKKMMTTLMGMMSQFQREIAALRKEGSEKKETVEKKEG